MKSTLKYIELKSGQNDCGPAWIGYAKTSKTGQTIYFNGMALKRIKGGGISGNYFNIVTGDEYWVSGVKKNRQDRHWAGSGKINIEAVAVTEYLQATNCATLNTKTHVIVAAFEPTEPSSFLHLENEPLP